jgi:hypothetical protein
VSERLRGAWGALGRPLGSACLRHALRRRQVWRTPFLSPYLFFSPKALVIVLSSFPSPALPYSHQSTCNPLTNHLHSVTIP